MQKIVWVDQMKAHRLHMKIRKGLPKIRFTNYLKSTKNLPFSLQIKELTTYPS